MSKKQMDLDFTSAPDAPCSATDLIELLTYHSAHLEHNAFAGHIPGTPPVPLYIAFSGGRSSAYMTEIILRDYKHRFHPVYITFANTGQEHPLTLDFVYQCQQRWEQLYNTTVIWLEALVNKLSRGKKGSGTRYTVVDFFSATQHESFKGPFTDVIEKYGIPSPTSRNVCNRELKLAPQNAFRRDLEKQLGSKKIYTAIGIRGDEPKRHDSIADQRSGKYCYPMNDLFFTDKEDVLDFWKEDMPFNLQIPEELGNCLTCWKKSFKKLQKVAQTNHHYFWFFDIHQKINSRTNIKEGVAERRFFRGYLTPQDIINIALNNASRKELMNESELYRQAQLRNEERDAAASGSCTEECQAAPSVSEIQALDDELDDENYTPPTDLAALFQRRVPVLNMASL